MGEINDLKNGNTGVSYGSRIRGWNEGGALGMGSERGNWVTI